MSHCHSAKAIKSINGLEREGERGLGTVIFSSVTTTYKAALIACSGYIKRAGARSILTMSKSQVMQ